MRKRWADDLAAFVVTTGIAPSEYRQLTLLEREAIIAAHKRANRKG